MDTDFSFADAPDCIFHRGRRDGIGRERPRRCTGSSATPWPPWSASSSPKRPRATTTTEAPARRTRASCSSRGTWPGAATREEKEAASTATACSSSSGSTPPSATAPTANLAGFPYAGRCLVPVTRLVRVRERARLCFLCNRHDTRLNMALRTTGDVVFQHVLGLSGLAARERHEPEAPAN